MITKLKPYPAYKESGMPWLGQVPEHWEVAPIRAFARPGYKTFTDGDWIESPYIRDEGIRLIQTGNIGIGSYREQGFRYIDEETFKQFRCTEIQPRDILICRLAEPVGRACLAPDLGVRMITSVDVCILKSRSDVDPAFVVYALSYQGYLSWMNSICRGGTRDRVSRSMLGSIRIQKPPFDEQTAIVRFLDYMDRRIRRYVRAKQKLIKLLEEYKQALIHQAVTGSIDVRTGKPYLAYKGSGVEWLGEVPEHWEIRRLGSSVRGCVNGVWGSEPNGKDDLPCVRVADFDRSRLRVHLDKPTMRAISSSDRVRRLLEPGDLLLEKSGGGDLQPVGRVVLYDHPTVAVTSNFIARMPVENGYDSIYLTYLHAALYSIELNVRSIKQTTGIQNLDSRTYLSELVAFPPLPEQTAIVEYLDTQTTKIDAAIAATRSEIELLREYRTRLISDVVTGKADVREAAARLPEELSEEEAESMDAGGIVEDEATDDDTAAETLSEEEAEP